MDARRLKELEDEAAREREKAGKYTRELEALDKNYKDSKRDIGDLTNERDATKRRAGELETENERLKRELQELQRALEREKGSKDDDRLRKELAARDILLNEALQKNRDQAAANDREMQALKDKLRDAENAKRKNGDLEYENEKLQKMINDLKKQLENPPKDKNAEALKSENRKLKKYRDIYKRAKSYSDKMGDGYPQQQQQQQPVPMMSFAAIPVYQQRW